jgi:polyphosphate kinase 2 (PPK2 family)
MPYIGKGGFKRAITSAIEHKRVVSAIIWAPVQTEKGAFVAEYLLQLFRTPNKGQLGTFNKIWSPGKKIFDSLTKI